MTAEEIECSEIYRNFKRVRNLSKEIPECPFDFDIKLPKPPKKETISNYGKPKEQRKFPYYNIDLIKKLPTDKASDFVKKELYKRKNGFWFFNGDELEYITGSHYMFLQYWTVEAKKKLDDGTFTREPSQPFFVDMQRDWYYAWDYVVKDNNSFGMIFLGRRRTAKTEMAISEGYWHATGGERRRFLIQSKTDVDGAVVLKKLVTAWQNMPYIWKPTDKGASDVRKKIEFREPTKRDSKNKQSDRHYKGILDSEIGYMSSSETALDGQSVSRILNDEVFKTPKKIADIKKRWEINQKCLVDGTDIIGKALLTSTVEEVDKDGIQHMIELSNESLPSTINPATSRTISGLYMCFFPAYYGLSGTYNGTPLTDEWGYSNMKAAKEFLEQDRLGKTGKSLIDEKRRNPFTMEEAFYFDSKQEVFSQEPLQSQSRYNKAELVYEKKVRRGNFYWVNGVKWGDVAWRENDQGRWLRSEDSPEENKNRNRIVMNQKTPTGRMFYTGCDPVDHTATRDGTGSMPVAYTLAMPNPLVKGLKRKTVVCRYSYRHPDPNLFYEDMIMQCVYYNSLFLAENQKYGVLNYFKDKGFDGYCMYDPTESDLKRKMKNKGLPTTGGEMRNHLIRLGQAFVNENVGYLPDTNEYGRLDFEDLIKDLLIFNPTKWTPHDDTVAFLITLCAASEAAQSTITSTHIPQFLPKPLFKKR